jgi:3-oxoacyl-[acyl-carrier protein] reductase
MKKHTLVVGGTRGMGRALVEMLSKEGHKVSVIGRRSPSGEDSEEVDVRYWLLDLMDRVRLWDALKEIIAQNGKLNNLVFFQRYRGEGDDWQGEVETSLTATRNIIEGLIDAFDDSKENAIVMANSIAGTFIVPEQPVSYHMAKAALNQMVRYFAVTLGPKGIRVNSISSGTVLKEESKSFYLENKRLHDLYKRIIPCGRMGTSEDIASTVSFLCSAKALFITGQNIMVDGGLSLRAQEGLARELMSLDQLFVEHPAEIT